MAQLVCQKAAVLTHDEDPSFKIYNVVSSAFHWFGPGLQNFHFDWGHMYASLKTGEAPSSAYRARRLLANEIKDESEKERVHKRNNFARIIAKADEVRVQFFRGDGGNGGRPIETTIIP